MRRIDLRHKAVAAILIGICWMSPAWPAAAEGQQGAGQSVPGTPPSSDPQTSLGQKNTSSTQKSGQDTTSAAKPASPPEQSASTKKLKLSPTAPSDPPSGLPTNRPVIGLALGGGAALAISEIGMLQWLDEHHVPVDVIAGTSMGSILAALYSTGVTPEQMKHILNPGEVNRVFRIASSYSNRSFRRREDERAIPNGIGIGLKHGVSMRNALLTDTGLNELLDKEFIRYNDQLDFNTLPIPFRCRATDLTTAKSVVFARGSLQDAVRASASLPGVFQPFQMGDQEYVDGAILDNLPVSDVKAMKADVIIAYSLPLSPVGKGDLGSIVGVLQRAFAVGIEVNEEKERKLANVVVMPDISGFTASDYSKTDELAARGYAAAEAHKAELLKYALSDAQWQAYMAKRRAKERPPVGTVLQVKVKAPTPEVVAVVRRKFGPMVNQPIDTDKIEALLTDIRADGRYNADYTVGYDSAGSDRPIILVDVEDKKNGPPFAAVGFNIEAQTGGVTRATVDSRVIYQDLGGYGSEARAKIDLGFLTQLDGEYFHLFVPTGYFVAPRVTMIREPFYIYQPNSNRRLSERQSQFAGVGADVGWTDRRAQELRLGWAFNNVQWHTTTGFDNLPDYADNSQTARVQYIFDSEDRALVPRFGLRLTSRFGYLYDTPGSPTTPQFYTQAEGAHTLAKKNVLLARIEGATMFNHDVPQPFRYTLGGPLRLSAEAIDQIRGTDYWLAMPGYLRQVFSLKPPLGQNIYVGAAVEAGQMRSPDGPTITREDVYFGIVAETPLGVITFAPAFGSNGQRKFNFTIGRFF